MIPKNQRGSTMNKIMENKKQEKIVERWTQRCRNWDVVLSQLSIIFEDRIPA